MAKNATISTYANGINRPVIQYSEHGRPLFSLPARLNNFRMPDLNDCAAILAGVSVTSSAGWRIASTGPEYLNALRELVRAEQARLHALRDLERITPIRQGAAVSEFLDGFAYSLAMQTDWRDIDAGHVRDLLRGLIDSL